MEKVDYLQRMANWHPANQFETALEVHVLRPVYAYFSFKYNI